MAERGLLAKTGAGEQQRVLDPGTAAARRREVIMRERKR
jgi:hypothetical protein